MQLKWGGILYLSPQKNTILLCLLGAPSLYSVVKPLVHKTLVLKDLGYIKDNIWKPDWFEAEF